MKISQHKTNSLLNREEYMLFLEHAGKPTPKRAEIWQAVAEMLKKEKDHIIVDKIMSVPGQGGSNIKVLVYDKKDNVPKAKLEKMMARIEKKKAGEEGEAPAEAPAEAKAEKKEKAK